MQLAVAVAVAVPAAPSYSANLTNIQHAPPGTLAGTLHV